MTETNRPPHTDMIRPLVRTLEVFLTAASALFLISVGPTAVTGQEGRDPSVVAGAVERILQGDDGADAWQNLADVLGGPGAPGVGDMPSAGVIAAALADSVALAESTLVSKAAEDGWWSRVEVIGGQILADGRDALATGIGWFDTLDFSTQLVFIGVLAFVAILLLAGIVGRRAPTAARPRRTHRGRSGSRSSSGRRPVAAPSRRQRRAPLMSRDAERLHAHMRSGTAA